MFTGLIQKIGRVKRVSRGKGLVLEFAFDPWPEPLVKGESVAVNGVCLTVVDCDRTRGTVAARVPKGRDFALKISCPRAIAAASVLKGSIAVNGVSLTVSGLGDDWLQVDVIPTTAAETNLGSIRVGEKVNLESDVLGKYAIRSAETDGQPEREGGGLTMEMLEENGFL